MNEAIRNALDTPEFDRTSEQVAICSLYESAQLALNAIESAGSVEFPNRRDNAVSVLKAVVK